MRRAVIGLVLVLACGDSGGSSDATATDPTASTMPPTTVDPATSGSPSSTSATTMPPTSSGPTMSTTIADTGSSDTTGGPPGEVRLYGASADGVTVWALRRDTGALTEQATLDLGDGVGPLGVSPARDVLFARLAGSGDVVSMSIDPVTGDIAELGRQNPGLFAVYLYAEASGGYLLMASFGEDNMSIFPIEPSGVIAAVPSHTQAVSEEPHAIITDPANEFIFIPHRNGNVIEQYVFDSATGTMAPNAVPSVAAPPGVGPRHIVFHPDATYAFVVNEMASSVSSYSYDSTLGQLTLIDSYSTLPGGFPDQNTGADIHVTADGNYVYSSNRGHDSLAMFSVDSNTGVLTSLGQADTEATPREFEVALDLPYVYALGQDSAMMASYTIEADGTLTAGPVYASGSNPLWALAVELPAN